MRIKGSGKFAQGATKARRRMKRMYGNTEGDRIFLARAEERGRGKTLLAKINSTYRRGAKLKSK